MKTTGITTWEVEPGNQNREAEHGAAELRDRHGYPRLALARGLKLKRVLKRLGTAAAQSGPSMA
jgi:hypothetical protein